MKIGYNVGSGQRPFKSNGEVIWRNVDSQEKWNPDIRCRGEELPCSDDSVDYVVLHHVLEHFGCGEGAGLIKEAHRVLRPRGLLQVFVPNLCTLAHRWRARGISTQIYMTNIYGAYMGNEDDRHKWGFDAQSLSDFLHCCDWALISDKCRDIPGADVARDWWILETECVK